MCDIVFKPDPTPAPNATTTLYGTNEFYGVLRPKVVGNDTDHSGNDQLIGDVFSKGDADKDGLISIQEFLEVAQEIEPEV